MQAASLAPILGIDCSLALFSSRGPAQSLADSRGVVRGHRARIGAWLAIWLLASLLLTAAVSGLLGIAGVYLIPLAVTSVKTLLFALGNGVMWPSFLTVLAAAGPILMVLYLMIGRRWGGSKAGPAGWLTAGIFWVGRGSAPSAAEVRRKSGTWDWRAKATRAVMP